MKYFVQFQTESSGKSFKDGKIIDVLKYPIDALGSDSVFILDGRNSLTSMKYEAKKRIEQLKNIHTYIGYKIMKGERFTNSKEIYNSIK